MGLWCGTAQLACQWDPLSSTVLAKLSACGLKTFLSCAFYRIIQKSSTPLACGAVLLICVRVDIC